MSGLIRLENRSVIEIGGKDARDFLQGILTNDIEGAKDDSAIYAGLLTPQGKLLFDFMIVKHEDSYLLDVEKSQVDDLLKRLMFYRLRAKVDLDPHPGAVICANLDAKPQDGDVGLSYTDPRYGKMGSRHLILNSIDNAWTPDADKWLAHRSVMVSQKPPATSSMAIAFLMISPWIS